MKCIIRTEWLRRRLFWLSAALIPCAPAREFRCIEGGWGTIWVRSDDLTIGTGCERGWGVLMLHIAFGSDNLVLREESSRGRGGRDLL